VRSAAGTTRLRDITRARIQEKRLAASEGKPTIALALAGGNALGAYSAGAYEALHERGYRPDVVSGASIGAINGAIIAGNPPQRRVEKLREFWQQAGTGSAFGLAPATGRSREIYNAAHALQTLMAGRPGLFTPRLPGLFSILPGMPPDVALFDSKPLVATLERVIDFDVLNAAEVALLVSAVDMESGEAVVFDTRREKLEVRHFLATTAFTPGFPPVEIGGRCLADPGLISNLPIDAVLDCPRDADLICFALDLFESRGVRPHSIDTGLERAQDIIFSAQSLGTIKARSREHRLRHVICELALHLSAEQRVASDAAALLEEGRDDHLTLVLLAYRARAHELSAKMLEFSRASIDERWAIGGEDMQAALVKLEAGKATERAPGYTFYDGRRAHADDGSRVSDAPT
jgi:NTE family protein